MAQAFLPAAATRGSGVIPTQFAAEGYPAAQFRRGEFAPSPCYDFRIMKTVLLLICSNIFMTIAWYGHLKYRKAPLLAAIVVSWMIAFFEYCFQVPANRIGYGQFTGFQLKVIQEVITLCVFVVFAWLYLGERVKWNHAVSFLFLIGAVTFAFWGRL
jgi:uncharacterized protein